MSNRLLRIAALAAATLVLSACPKGNQDYQAGKKAEAIQDYDTALVHYQRALKADPLNSEYRLKATRIRFEAAQAHVAQGQRLRDKGDLTLALAEFEKASAIDPGSAIAQQELRRTLEMAGGRATGSAPPGGASAAPAPAEAPLDAPPQLRPISRDPINLRLTNDARIVYETVAKLAGLTVIFDADFQPRRISTDLANVTLEDALDVVALQSKTSWKPVTGNVIFVYPDQPQKRKDYEELVIKTFYLSNTVQPQDLTEIVNGLRQLFELRRIQQINSQNAIVIRDTPDKLALVDKILRDVDKAKPEVVIQVSVLQARRDRARDLGILPGSSSVLSFTPRNPTGGTSSGSGSGSSSVPQVTLNELQRLSSADYSITLPGATATALITDSNTKIIQNPEIRTVDGQSAKLRVGDRVPIATGSFQAGVGVGGTTATGVINPLVNTQFQYQEVGVNIDVTPRIHASREVSLKIAIEVSSVSGRVTIGGIEQPIISQRKIEHDVRLKEGEVNVLGGLVERSDVKSISGWPGLSKIPFMRYFFSSESVDTVENEVLIVLTPRIVRLSEITAENMRGVSSGTDQYPQVRRVAGERPATPQPAIPGGVAAPAAKPPAAVPPVAPQPGHPEQPQESTALPARPQAAPATQPPAAATEAARPARLRFDAPAAALKVGDTATITLMVDDVKDLFSIPLLLQFNPKVIQIEEVRHGGFLSGGTAQSTGTQEIAIVQRVDKERGTAIVSATRQPNTPGVSGSGALIGIVIRAVAPGTSALQIPQVRAMNSQAQPISFVSSEATIRVQ